MPTIMRDVARFAYPAELAGYSDIQGFHQLNVELDVNIAVEVTPEGEEDRLVVVHVDRTAFSPSFPEPDRFRGQFVCYQSKDFTDRCLHPCFTQRNNRFMS